MAKKKSRKRTVRRNPSPVKSRARSAAKRIGKSFMGLNMMKALKDIPATQIGMFGAKFLAKKFGDAATETDPATWSAMSYIKGGLGAVATGILLNMVKPGMGQVALAGGLNLMVYKMVQNEGIVKSAWATGQFGEDSIDVQSYLGEDLPEEYILEGSNGPMMYAEDGRMLPADDSYRGVTVEPGRLGSAFVEPGRLGSDPYAKAFQGN